MKTPPKNKPVRRQGPEATEVKRPGKTPAPAASERTDDPDSVRSPERRPEQSQGRQLVTNQDEQDKITNANDEQSAEPEK